jgi:hypothetical protein
MPAEPPGFTPTIKQWYDKLALKSEGTAKGYLSNLKTLLERSLTIGTQYDFRQGNILNYFQR